MTVDAKVQIGLSGEFLEGTSVTTPAGNNLFREGVVVSDPESPDARARILDQTPTGTEFGLAVRQVGEVDANIVTPVEVFAAGPLPVSGSVDVSNLPATYPVSATDFDIRNLNRTQDNVRSFDSTDDEYLTFAGTVNLAGDTVLVTPAAGKRIRLQWVYAVNDPVAMTSTKITVKLGADVKYVSWFIQKRQQLTGPVDGALVINLSNSGDVAVTVFYQEVD